MQVKITWSGLSTNILIFDNQIFCFWNFFGNYFLKLIIVNNKDIYTFIIIYCKFNKIIIAFDYSTIHVILCFKLLKLLQSQLFVHFKSLPFFAFFRSSNSSQKRRIWNVYVSLCCEKKKFNQKHYHSNNYCIMIGLCKDMNARPLKTINFYGCFSEFFSFALNSKIFFVIFFFT